LVDSKSFKTLLHILSSIPKPSNLTSHIPLNFCSCTILLAPYDPPLLDSSQLLPLNSEPWVQELLAAVLLGSGTVSWTLFPPSNHTSKPSNHTSKPPLPV
ncbi:hypothetical protein LDENG_00196710, partial [Lucifuga dentata]